MFRQGSVGFTPHRTMQPHSIDLATSSADLVAGVTSSADEPKCTFCDILMSTGQVAAVVGLCWVVHVLV